MCDFLINVSPLLDCKWQWIYFSSQLYPQSPAPCLVHNWYSINICWKTRCYLILLLKPFLKILEIKMRKIWAEPYERHRSLMPPTLWFLPRQFKESSNMTVSLIGCSHMEQLCWGLWSIGRIRRKRRVEDYEVKLGLSGKSQVQNGASLLWYAGHTSCWQVVGPQNLTSPAFRITFFSL